MNKLILIGIILPLMLLLLFFGTMYVADRADDFEDLINESSMGDWFGTQ